MGITDKTYIGTMVDKQSKDKLYLMNTSSYLYTYVMNPFSCYTLL